MRANRIHHEIDIAPRSPNIVDCLPCGSVKEQRSVARSYTSTRITISHKSTDRWHYATSTSSRDTSVSSQTARRATTRWVVGPCPHSSHAPRACREKRPYARSNSGPSNWPWIRSQTRTTSVIQSIATQRARWMPLIDLNHKATWQLK